MVFRWKETQYFTCVFNSQSYFKVHKTARLNATNFFIKEIPNKRELQQKVSKHSADAKFKNFTKL